MPLQDDFKARFPEFTGADVDTAWTNLAASWPCYYNFEYGVSSCIDEAIFQLIAHLFAATSDTSSPLRTVAGQSVGSISQTFSVASDTSDRASFFGSTKYGQMFLILTRARYGAVWV